MPEVTTLEHQKFHLWLGHCGIASRYSGGQALLLISVNDAEVGQDADSGTDVKREKPREEAEEAPDVESPWRILLEVVPFRMKTSRVRTYPRQDLHYIPILQ